MRRFVKSSVMLAVIVCLVPMAMLSVVMGAVMCPDYGPVDSLCPNQTSSDCNGTITTCSNDTKEVLATDKFACGTVKGQKNCRTGIVQQLCYTKWQCKWVVGTGCVQNDATKDPHNAATMTSDPC